MPHFDIETSTTELPVCSSEYARQHFLFNATTGEVIPLNCKSWRCPVHQRSWLHKWRMVVSWQITRKPVDRLVTLTCGSDCYPDQLSKARQILMRDLRDVYGKFEYLSVLEFTTRTRLPHLHLLVYSDRIPQKFLSILWYKATSEAGIPNSYVVYIEKPRSQNGSAFYALKYALSGSEKGQEIPETWRGRKITYSDGFFEKPVSEIWDELVQAWLGDKEPVGEFELRERLSTFDLYPEAEDWRYNKHREVKVLRSVTTLRETNELVIRD